MKISAIKRLVLQDFPQEVQKWMIKLIQPLNQLTEQVISALQNGLTIGDNMKCKKYDLSIAANQSYPIKLAYNLNQRPVSVHVAYCMEDSGSPTAPTAAYSVWWKYDSDGLQITMIGLDAAKRYNVTIIAQC